MKSWLTSVKLDEREDQSGSQFDHSISENSLQC